MVIHALCRRLGGRIGEEAPKKKDSSNGLQTSGYVHVYDKRTKVLKTHHVLQKQQTVTPPFVSTSLSSALAARLGPKKVTPSTYLASYTPFPQGQQPVASTQPSTAVVQPRAGSTTTPTSGVLPFCSVLHSAHVCHTR